LLAVLAILSVTVILAVPLLNRFSPGLELKSTARTVAAAMREARALAIRDNGEVAVLIDLDNHLVSVGQGRNAAVINPRVGISLYTAAEELEGAGAGRIRFFADGTSTGGRVRLSLDGRQFDVTVNWITGGVAIDD